MGFICAVTSEAGKIGLGGYKYQFKAK